MLGGERPGLLWLAIAASVFAVQVAFCVWWLTRYRSGPMGWVWCPLTYGRVQAMLCPSITDAAAQ